jgi:L-iditol 2-dehydrogenase
MRAAYVPEPGRIEMAEFSIPEPAEGQVLVKMHLASICGSDLHVVYHGFQHAEALGHPGYPGHEGVGEVVASRSPDYADGQLVLTVPVGWFGGCFSEYQVIDACQLVPLPPGDAHRLLLGQQLGTTIYAMKKFWPAGQTGEGKVVAIIGAGSAGLFFAQHVKALGFDHLIVSDLEASRLDVAKRLGADHTVHAPGQAIGPVIEEVTAGRGADFIIEAAGFDSLRAAAVEALADHGTVGFYGFPEHYGAAPFPSYTAFRKSAVMQWVCSAQLEPGLTSFREAVAAISDGTIQVDYCLEPVFPLERVPDAIALAERRGDGAVKLTIDIQAAGAGAG